MFGVYSNHGHRAGGEARFRAMRGMGHAAGHVCRGRHFHPFGHEHAFHAGPGIEGDEGDFLERQDGGHEMRGGGGGERHGGFRGWGRGWGFGGEFGGRGPTGRPLEQGDLRWLTLDLIAAQPRHGYEIIKAIGDALSGHYTPSPGVIYPTLTLLEETGLIASEAQGPKKLYRLTDEGRAEVVVHAADIQAAKSRLSQANARFGGAPTPELLRALNNLRAALQVRLGKGPLTPAALNTITAALDRAAGEIERS